MDNKWWTSVPNAVRMIEEVDTSLRGGSSVLLILPDKTPWREEFLKQIEDRGRMISGYTNKREADDRNMNPGEYILKNYCKDEKKYEYRPSMSYAGFLAKADNIILNAYGRL